MAYIPQLRDTVEGIARDIFQLVVGQVELDKVGEVPQGEPVKSGDVAVVEGDLLEVEEMARGEDITGQHIQVTSTHIQHLEPRQLESFVIKQDEAVQTKL